MSRGGPSVRLSLIAGVSPAAARSGMAGAKAGAIRAVARGQDAKSEGGLLHGRKAVTEVHMQHLVAIARGLASDEGQDLLEYGLLAVLIAIFCMGAVTLLGNQINTVMWQTIANNF